MTKSYVESDKSLYCNICNDKRMFKFLGAHITTKHHITTRKYKEMFNLDYNLPLMNSVVQEKKKLAFELHREKYLKNLTVTNRFKKGVINRQRFSKQSIDRAIKNIDGFRTSGVCKICKMHYEHLHSHLYNKHSLLLINKEFNGISDTGGRT